VTRLIQALLIATIALLPTLSARADRFAFLQPQPDPASEAADAADDADAAPAADEAAKPDAGDDAPAEALRIVITGVKGLVRVRQAEDQPWEAAKVGMELSQEAEFRTGPRSSVQIKIFPHHVVTLDRLGTIKVLRAIRQDGELKTDVGMKYGRTRYQIQAGGAAHEATIRSPSATLAVRGSEVLAEDYPDRPARYIVYNSPDTSLNNRQGFEFPIVRGQIRLDDRTVPDTAVADATVDPRDDLALDDVESELAEDHPALLGTGLLVDLTRMTILNGSNGSAGFQPPSDGVGSFDFQPGELKFTLTWQGIADVDLDVMDSAGFTTSVFPGVPPGSMSVTPTGGVASADDLGPNGMEMITWSAQHLAGLHTVTARLFEFQGSGSAAFNITVTQTLPGGQPQILQSFDGGLDANTPTFTDTVNVPAISVGQ